MNIFSISSSSDGNAYALYSNPDNIILIDAGVPLKRIKYAFDQYKLDIKHINYVIISHTHSDHIKGLQALLNNTEAFVVCSDDNAGRIKRFDNDTLIFSNHQPFILGDINIMPVEASHDTPTSSFVFSNNHVNIGIVTDTGYVSRTMQSYLSNINMLILESNYSLEHLPSAGYPMHLQRRISSNRGHLSNEQALKVIENLYHDNLSHVMFAHVSKRSNSPDIVQMEIVNDLQIRYPDTAFTIAPYDSFSDILHI